MKAILNLGDKYVFHKETEDSSITLRSGNLKSLSNSKRTCNKNYHLMYDRRIARGNTFCYTSEAVLAMAGDNIKRRRPMKKKSRLPNDRPLTPPPVCGRIHNIAQTDCVLEELWEKPPMDDVLCQTDPFMDRPMSPEFAPAKTGMDMETQIYPGELFDFDTEVRPITELLVGKTMEQALLEVMEEEELEALRYQQRRYEERRRAELLEQQRLEEQEKRLEDEKKRRILQHHEALRIQRDAERRLKASYFTIRYLRDLVPLNNLNREGFFVADATEDEIKNMFMPWLMREVRSELEVKKISRNLLDEMIRHYTTHRCCDYDQINEMDLNPPVEYDYGEAGEGYFQSMEQPVGDYDDMLPKI